MLRYTCVFLTLAIGFMTNLECHGDTFGQGINSFDIPFITIENPDNASDSIDQSPEDGIQGLGAVANTFRISKYEISEEMIEKANLLSAIEGSPLEITKDFRGPNKPATSISWYEAAQFTNWLNTNSGNMPAYKFDSAGNFQLWETTDTGFNPNNRFRNKKAKYFLPSADEWYKSAHYDSNSEVYFNFPWASNDIPDGIDFDGDPSFDLVFSEGFNQPEPNDVVDVGVLSTYGVAGLGGNVAEWEETGFASLRNDTASLFRGVRGGSFKSSDIFLFKSARLGVLASKEDDAIGFRVASIPEPSSYLLAGISLLGGVCCSRLLRESVTRTS